MGKIEEAVNPADILDDPEKLKEAGNDFFKKSEWDSALDCYTQVSNGDLRSGVDFNLIYLFRPSRKPKVIAKSRRRFISRIELLAISRWIDLRMPLTTAQNHWILHLMIQKLCSGGVKPTRLSIK